MNITVKAPPGGEYYTDIAKTKKRYFQKLIYTKIVAASVWAVGLVIWSIYLWKNISFSGSLGRFLWPFTLFILAVWIKYVWGIFYKKVKKVHFQCPYCKEEIPLDAPWDCYYCVTQKTTVPTLFSTFFNGSSRKSVGEIACGSHFREHGREDFQPQILLVA